MTEDQKDQKDDAPLHSDQAEDKDKGTPNDKPDDKKDPSDNLTPEHPRFKQVLDKQKASEEQNKILSEKLEVLQATITKRKEESGEEDLTQDEKDALAKIDRQMSGKYLTKEDLAEDKRVEKRAQEMKDLSREFPGPKGGSKLPPFVSVDVVAYAKEHGLGDNLKAAYREMHFDAIVKVQSEGGETLKPPISEAPTGGEEREAPEGEVTPKQIAAMSDKEWAEKGPDIMAAMKAGAK